MIEEEAKKHRDTYNHIKKRLKDYRYRYIIFTTGTVISFLALILSVLPFVPVAIVTALGLSIEWNLIMWVVSIVGFSLVFLIFQRLVRNTLEKRGITLEEKMYIPAYESLINFREYTDPNHPIQSGKPKAVSKLRSISVLIEEVGFPYIEIVREERLQLSQLWRNLRTRLIPSIEKRINGDDPETLRYANSSLIALLEYLSEPELDRLKTLNQTMEFLPETQERNIFLDFKTMVFRRTNLRHAIVFFVIALATSFIACIDLNIVGGDLNAAYTLGITSFLAMTAIYVAYLGLSTPRTR